MNILLASESFYPVISGVAIAVEALATEMAKRNHVVTVVAPSEDRSFHRAQRNGYTIYRLPSRPNPFRKGLRFTPFSYRYMKRVFDEVHPDIVHIHDPAALGQATVRRARKYKIPIVATQHFGFEYLLTYLPALKQFHPLIKYVAARNIYALYNRCAVVTVPSKTLKEALSNNHLKVPTEVISNGVDIKRFKPGSTKVGLLYVGRVDPEKNLGILLEAVEKLGIPLTIAGKGNSLLELQKKAQQLGISKYITWRDPIPHESPDFPELYAEGTVFCMPSPIETESIVTMEAMASGLPIVAANGGALPELVKDGKNGYLVDPNDPEAWVSVLSDLLEDPAAIERLGKKSRQFIEPRSNQHTFNGFEALYKTTAVQD